MAPHDPAVTTVTIPGDGANPAFTVDLHHMTPADGEKLYAALGNIHAQTNYQTLADGIAALAQNFESLITVELPPGVDLQQAFQKLETCMRKNGGQLAADAEPYLQKMYSAMPGAAQTALQLACAPVKTAQATVSFFDGLMMPLNALQAAVDATGTTLKADWRAIHAQFTMSPVQAKAFGAAYAAAYYEQVDAPDAPTQVLRRDPEWGDRAGAHVQSWWEKAWFALGPELRSRVLAAIDFVLHMTDKSWEQCLSDARAKTEAEPAIARTYEEILAENTQATIAKTARVAVGDVLQQADKIAGHSTTELAKLVTAGEGLVYTNDGKEKVVDWEASTPSNPTPSVATLTDSSGNEKTSGSEVKAAWTQLVDTVIPESNAGKIGAGVAALGVWRTGPTIAKAANHVVIKPAVGLVRGAAAVTATVASGVVDGLGSVVTTKEGLAAKQASATLAKLEAKHIALDAQFMATPEPSSPAAKLKAATKGELPEQILEKFEDVHGEIHDGHEKRNWRGKKIQIPSATEDAASAADALKAQRDALATTKTAPLEGGIWNKSKQWIGKVGASITEARVDAGERLAEWSAQAADKLGITALEESAPRVFTAAKWVGAGLGRLAPVVDVGIVATDGYDTVDALQKGDGRGAAVSGAKFATATGGAAIGAGLGVLGGPLAPATVPAGALIGLTVGSIASMFTGEAGGMVYDEYAKKPAAPIVKPEQKTALATNTPSTTPDRGLQAAIEAQECANRAASKAGQAMQNCKVTVGAIMSGDQLPAANAQTLATRKPGFVVPIGG